MTGLYAASNPPAAGVRVQLQRNIGDLGDVLTRLSTGLRINSAKDDPAGLVASQLLKSDIAASKQAIQNTTLAGNLLATADNALGQVHELLVEIRVLINDSENDPDVNQLKIDAAVDSIDRIVKTTSFQGQKLLDGSLGFRTTGDLTSSNSPINNVQIQQANFGVADSLEVNVKLLEASRRGTLIYHGTGVDQETFITIGGSLGNHTFNFVADTTIQEIATEINAMSDVTGVKASVDEEPSEEALILEAMQPGSSHFVDVKVIGDSSFDTFDPLGLKTGYSSGTDAKITVNAQKTVTDGDNFRVSGSRLQMSGTVNTLDVDETATFTITGGAAFQLGPNVVSSQQIRIGIDAQGPVHLGGPSGQLYMLMSGEKADLRTNRALADRIVQEAIRSVAMTQGRLGAIQKSTLEPNKAMLEDTTTQLTATNAVISNVDFAEASSELARLQVLIQSGSQALALVNHFPQYAVQLLQ